MITWIPNRLEREVLSGDRCGYCRRPTELKQIGNYWKRVCSPCDAYVGVRSNGTALGRVAKLELRQKRMAAHAAFDPIWRSGQMSRSAAYRWLSAELGIPTEYCHMGMLGTTSCERVVILCQQFKEQQQYESTRARTAAAVRPAQV